MLTVTNLYKDNIYANSRKIRAKTIFEILDVGANLDATVTVTAENSFSKKDQTVNLNRQMSTKFATFENDYWKLDGSFFLPPKTTETGYEVGWWSNDLSQANSTYLTSQVLTIQFSLNHSSIGISITFDTLTNEYADSFIIQVYDSSNVLINSISVTGNTSSKYDWENNLNNYRKIVLTITKWCKPYRRARVTEIDFGIIKEYTGEEIIKLNVLEEFDTISNSISTNEIQLTLDNANKIFNLLNPTGIYSFLQRKQKIIPYLGLYINDNYTEYVPMGVFYLSDWESEQGNLTAKFTAKDVIDILEQGTFPQTTYTSKTLKFILDSIFASAGITDYFIDSNLNLITVSGTLPESSYREAIQTVAIAGQSVVYADRKGILQIKQLTNTSTVDSLNYENMYKSAQIKLSKLINTVNVKYGANIYTLVDPAKPTKELTQSVTVENALISTLTHAQNVANWLLTELKKRYLYEINWRMNPALEIGDIVTIEDDFSENKTARITKNEFEYSGYLSGKTSARGGG